MKTGRNVFLVMLISAVLMLTITPMTATPAFSVTPMLAGGNGHTLALKSDGTVWAWGSNEYGQLGNGLGGTANNRSAPVQVKDENNVGYLSDVIALADGGDHSLALDRDGTVWAWGHNDYGQLGNNSIDRLPHSTPVRVKGKDGVGYLSGMKALVAAYDHSLVLASDGTVWAWGHNEYGELGDGHTANQPTPVQMLDSSGQIFTGVIALAGGEEHTLALAGDGKVWAWGFNMFGELGNGISDFFSHPIPVQALSDVKTIAAGLFRSLALRDDGTVWGWGSNSGGQLGDGTITGR
ncbi:MAG: hypothetical protein LBQ00_07225 [Syntrophobacterales bacterium]|nr:hypothetical protein [Syntrophobacterales bacterium]